MIDDQNNLSDEEFRLLESFRCYKDTRDVLEHPFERSSPSIESLKILCDGGYLIHHKVKEGRRLRSQRRSGYSITFKGEIALRDRDKGYR